MNVTSTKLAPPNSLLIIADLNGGDAPKSLGISRIASTPSCVVIGCLSFADGDTTVTLGPSDAVDQSQTLVFDGTIDSPNRLLRITTIESDVVAEISVVSVRPRIRIWANRVREPDQVFVGVDG